MVGLSQTGRIGCRLRQAFAASRAPLGARSATRVSGTACVQQGRSRRSDDTSSRSQGCGTSAKPSGWRKAEALHPQQRRPVQLRHARTDGLRSVEHARDEDARKAREIALARGGPLFDWRQLWKVEHDSPVTALAHATNPRLLARRFSLGRHDGPLAPPLGRPGPRLKAQIEARRSEHFLRRHAPPHGSAGAPGAFVEIGPGARGQELVGELRLLCVAMHALHAIDKLLHDTFGSVLLLVASAACEHGAQQHGRGRAQGPADPGPLARTLRHAPVLARISPSCRHARASPKRISATQPLVLPFCRRVLVSKSAWLPATLCRSA